MTTRQKQKIIGCMVIILAYFVFYSVQAAYAKELITGFENILYSFVLVLGLISGAIMVVT